MEKLVITVAPTGNVPTYQLNPESALTIDEIVSDVKKCKDAGAAVAHLHVRDKNLLPTSDRKEYKKLLEKLNDVDIIKQVSTGARGGENSIEWRGQMLDLDADMASLSTGSSNFPTSVNANAPDLIKGLAKKMLDNNMKPEIEVFDLAMIRNAVYLMKIGYLKGPLHFNMVMNVPGSIKGSAKNLMFMVDSIPKGSTWSVSGIGNSQIEMITMAILLGGHVRTGLEDVLMYDKDTYATNEMLVKRVVRIAKELGREIATVDEARKILSL
ncbi:MAG: 3-keto-5-aminohexanoate cleavage protein [Bacillota bacterium]|nr:3-keto-5-aminohexanoate cleavage protein [Bacillota bacterium]